jgi:hypothetical protein
MKKKIVVTNSTTVRTTGSTIPTGTARKKRPVICPPDDLQLLST